MRVAKGDLRFPERTVLLARASVEQLRASMITLNNIAELRRPKETAEFFDSLHPSEQLEWLEDLLGQDTLPVQRRRCPLCLSTRHWRQPRSPVAFPRAG